MKLHKTMFTEELQKHSISNSVNMGNGLGWKERSEKGRKVEREKNSK